MQQRPQVAQLVFRSDLKALEHRVEALQRTFSLLKRLNILRGEIQGTDHLPQPLAQGAEDLCADRERLRPQVFPLMNQQRFHQRQPLVDPCQPAQPGAGQRIPGDSLQIRAMMLQQRAGKLLGIRPVNVRPRRVAEFVHFRTQGNKIGQRARVATGLIAVVFMCCHHDVFQRED